MDKPPFDPSQPFEAAAKPPFDPSQPFEPAAAPIAADPAQEAQGARDSAAARVRTTKRPEYTRQPDATWADVGNAARDTVEQVGTGGNAALASTIARPLDAASNLLAKPAEWITGNPNPNPHMLENAVRSNFVDNHPQPKNDIERIARAGGGMAMENLPLAAGGVAAAAKFGPQLGEAVAPAVGGAWNTLKSGIRDYAGAMSRSPTKALVGDTMGAGEAGAGGEKYRQVAEDNGGNQQAGELAGQIGVPAAISAYAKFGPGGMARMVGAKVADTVLAHTPESILPAGLRPAGGSAAERSAERLSFGNNEGKYAPNEGVNNVPAKDLPVQPPAAPGYVARTMDAGNQARSDKATNIVAKEVGTISGRSEQNLTEANRLRGEIPGFEPGIAKSTNDPGLLNREANFDSKAINQELRGRQERTDASHGAIRTYLDETVPATNSPVPQDTAARANSSRVDRVSGKVDAQAESVRGQIRARSDALPEVDPTQTGNLMRETRRGLKQEADAHMGELRRGIDPDGTARVEISPATSEAEAVTVSVNQALDRRAQINQDLADHYSATNRDAAANREIRQLKARKDALDAAIEASGEAGTPGLAEYNRYYREDYAPKFLQGASRDVGRFNRNGYEGNRVASEDVPTKMLGPNSISEARQVNRLYGENPEIRQQIIDHHLDDLRRTAIDQNTGQLRQGAVDKYLAKNERLFNEMPWVREAVAAQNPDQLYQRLGQLEQRQRTVADTQAAKLVGKNGEDTIAAALADHTKMKALKASARGDPATEAALRRAVWEHVLARGGGDGPLNSEALQKLLQPEAAGGNRRALAQIFDAQHLNRIDNATAATRIENRLDRPTGTYEKPKNAFSHFEEALGTSVPSLGATASALARGRSSPVYEVPRVVLNAWRGLSEKQINAVWKEALSNPDVAQKLQMVGRGGIATPQQLGRMRNYTATLGIHDVKEAAGQE